MAKPIPGSRYTVVAGDTLRSISAKAYGYDRAADIRDANYGLLATRAKSLEGLPILYRGDLLSLPAAKKRRTTSITADDQDEISIRLDGKVFKGWTATNISRNINTIADGFTFEFPYDPFDMDLRERTAPFSYKTAELFIGDELYIAAQSIKWSPSKRKNQSTKIIDARTKAGHLFESMAQKRSLEFSDATLAEIATEILRPYGDDMAPVFLSGDSDRFLKVRKEITDTDFDFLYGLATQKGFMMTSSDEGGLAFLRANTFGTPVFKFMEGEAGIENISATYDGQKRWSSYQAVTESAGVPGPTSILEDPSIPVYRPFVFSADDLESSNLDTALQWRRAKALADACTLSIFVPGWRNDYNDLYRENMLGIVKAPSVDIFSETEYIISGVNPTKDENGGNGANIQLVLPQAYTLEFPSSFPWEG